MVWMCYAEFGELADELNVAGLEVGGDVDVSFAGAQVEFVEEGGRGLFFRGLGFIH